MTLIVVNYHYVRPRFDYPFPGIHGLTPEALEHQLRLLGGVGQFVSVDQVRTAARGGVPLPTRALLVTFDDGLREQIDHALPILDRLGIPAVFFVNTAPIASGTVTPVHQIHMLRAYMAPAQSRAQLLEEARRCGVEVLSGDHPEAAASYPWDDPESAQLKYLLNHALTAETRDALVAPCFRAQFGADETSLSRELYMDIEQLRSLSARGYLGTHGDRHLPLGRIPRGAAREDVRVSLQRLAEWTGVRPFALSYPFGTLECVTRDAQAAVAAEGLELAFTAERAANEDLERPLQLARFDSNDLPGGRRPCLGLEAVFEAAFPARWYR
jgi:peptidoglycan/xylan/chitin deacetylase (PgdA/CDA1 family)